MNQTKQLRTKVCHGLFLATILALFSACQSGTKKTDVETEDLAFWVNPFIGTGGEGHTFPGAVVPFGMVQLSPDTEVPSFRGGFPYCAGYQYDDSSIVGFSHTHFSGTGHSDLGDFLIMPIAGKVKIQPGSKENPDEGYRSRFSHANETATPGYYSVVLSDYNIEAELTASERVGFHKYQFNSADEKHLLLDLSTSIYNYDGKVTWSEIRIVNDTLITGYRQTKGWARNRSLYFAMVLSNPFNQYNLLNDEAETYMGFWPRDSVLTNFPERGGKALKLVLDFNAETTKRLMIKMAISAVSEKGAIANLQQEIPNWDFDKVKNEARAKWNKELNKVKVETNDVNKQIFYTSLYHSFLTPVIYIDINGKYRGLDNHIHQAEGFTNYTIFSLWDTYRATHPLFTLLQPARDGDMIQSMLMHYEQSAHKILPIWSFHGNETWCMIGYHAVPVIADAYLKGIRNFDVEKAWEAVTASANYGAYDGLEHYMKYNYMPIDLENEAASKTLEYAFDDFTIARFGEALGKPEADEFYKRAQNYRNIFDKETGFMRARKSNGDFREPFDPFYAMYGADYTEGNAWQYSWYVPHDPQGLIDLLGGKGEFVKRLDSLFILETNEEKFKHVEDIAGLIGQYAHGNEPSQHIAYLYTYAGMPWKTQEKIDMIMNNLFDNTPYGICGNEDCGQMSAWYIFSSMGFYPVAPGSNEYVFGTPRLQSAKLNLDNGSVFEIIAENLSDENIYIDEIILNNEVYTKNFIGHDDIIKGGKLIYKMSNKPNKLRGTQENDLPFSMSK